MDIKTGIFNGNENLCALKDQIEQKLEQEIEADSFEKCLEKVEHKYNLSFLFKLRTAGSNWTGILKLYVVYF